MKKNIWWGFLTVILMLWVLRMIPTIAFSAIRFGISNLIEGLNKNDPARKGDVSNV